MGESTFVWLYLVVPKVVCHIVCTDTQIIAGFFSEEKGQFSGYCKKVGIGIGIYLLSTCKVLDSDIGDF